MFRQKLRACRKGSALAMTAVMLPLILTAGAMAVDLGLAFAAKARADNVALMAAEAGEVRLPDSAAAVAFAEEVAHLILGEPGGYGGEPTVLASSDGESITVTVEISAYPFFGGLIGYRGSRIISEVLRPMPSGLGA